MLARDWAFLATRLLAVYLAVHAIDNLLTQVGIWTPQALPLRDSAVQLAGPVAVLLASIWLWYNAARVVRSLTSQPTAPADAPESDTSYVRAGMWAVAVAGLLIAVGSINGLIHNLGTAILQPENGPYPSRLLEAGRFSFRTQSMLIAVGFAAELVAGLLIFRWGRARATGGQA